MEGAHDLGGIGGFGPVRSPGSDATHYEDWELRAQTLTSAVTRGSRPWIERIEPATYLSTSYYARWLLAAEIAGPANGVFTTEEFEHAQRRIEAGEPVATSTNRALAERMRTSMSTPAPSEPAGEARFAVGDAVRPRRIYEPDVHHRIPRYVRGVLGIVDRVAGRERLAGYRGFDVIEPCYTVRFESDDVWGLTNEPPFAIHVDLWESYLEAAI